MRAIFNAIAARIEMVISRLNELTDVSNVSPAKFDRLEYNGSQYVNIPPIQQWVTVGTANAMYTTVQDAIDAIVDATAIKPYGILIHPGIHAGDIVGKDNVHLVGVSRISSIVTGKIDLSGTNASIERLGVQRTVASNGEVCVLMGDGSVFNSNILVFNTSDYALTALKVDNTSVNAITGIDGVGIYVLDTASTNKDITGIELAGLGSHLCFGNGLEINCNTASSGNFIGMLISGGTKYGGSSNRIDVVHSNAGFSGDVCFRKLTAAISPFNQAASFYTASGAGGGTCTAFCMNTSGGSGTASENGASFEISGYATENLDDTALGDTQIIRLLSQNTDLPSVGAGTILCTPRDANKSGFHSWVGTPSPYFTVGGTVNFTMNAAANGYIKDTPRPVAGGQSTVLTAQATSYIYADSDGVLQSSVVDPGYSVLRLFQAWCDGVNAPVVVRENHPYSYPSDVAKWAHDNFGSTVGATGADITILSAAGRTIKIVGANELDDHGIEDTIPDSAGAAVTWLQVYLDAGGKAATYANSTALGAVFNNAGTPSAAGTWVVWQLYVGKTNLNSSTPLYVAMMHGANFANQADAQAAIDGRQINNAPTELLQLEIVRLGYCIIRVSTTTIDSLTIDKKTGTSGASSGGSATNASLVATSVTSFNGWLSAVATSVQAALNALSALGLKGSVQTTDATATTLTSATIPSNVADCFTLVVSAFQTLTGDSKSWNLAYRVKNVAGTVTVEKFQEMISEDAGAAAWTAVVDVSGTTARVRVTGEAAHTIRWNCTLRRANYGGV